LSVRKYVIADGISVLSLERYIYEYHEICHSQQNRGFFLA